MRMTRLCSAGVVIWVCLPFLPAAATRFLGAAARTLPAGPSPAGRSVQAWRARALSSRVRPRRRSSSSRSLISMRGAGASPGRREPGSWMNAPVAAEPVTTGWGLS